MKNFKIGTVSVGNTEQITFILGPCQIESVEHAIKLADKINHLANYCEAKWIFLAPFDKSDRSTISAQRGAGIIDALKVYDYVREKHGVPVIADIHELGQASILAPHVDGFEITDLRSKHTDIIVEAAKTGKYVHIKKGQFLDAKSAIGSAQKAIDSGNLCVGICERGNMCGYDLIVDFPNIQIMKDAGLPVFFDATHSAQKVM